MTRLENEVTRVTDTVVKGRKVVVTLRPDQQIVFRLLGTQQKYKLDVATGFRWAEQASIEPIKPRTR